MKNTTAQRWARTTGANLTAPSTLTIMGKTVEYSPVGRKFRLTPKVNPASKDKRTEDTFVILALDPNMSNPKTFTFAKLKNDATGETFWSRIQHNNGYMVPENQK